VNVIIPEEIKECIDLASPREWSGFFEEMRQAEYRGLRSPDTSQQTLTELPVRVRLLDELEELFLRTRQTKPNQ